MAQNIPSWAKGLPNYTLYDKYDVARSGLIDTAETPQDKKRLKQDLQKLRQEYLALKAAQAKAKATPKATATKKPTPNKATVLRAPSKSVKTPMPKVEGAKTGAKELMPKTEKTKSGVKQPMSKTLTGPAAIKAIQNRTSPSGVKKAEIAAKKATDKKYPGLYKKSK